MPMDKDFTWKGADKGTPRDDKVVTNPDFKYAYGTVTIRSTCIYNYYFV